MFLGKVSIKPQCYMKILSANLYLKLLILSIFFIFQCPLHAESLSSISLKLTHWHEIISHASQIFLLPLLYLKFSTNF